MVTKPAGLFDILTTNEPIAAPPEREHEGVPSIVLATDEAIVQLPVSPVLNPEPETCIVSPPLPLLLGANAMVGTVTVNVGVETTVVCGTAAALVNPNVCGPARAALSTLKRDPARTPVPSMEQIMVAGSLKGAGISRIMPTQLPKPAI
jgi:hypothetical protein